MADQATLDAIETAELILQVDTGRAPADPFKLPATLQTLVTTRLTACKGKNAATTLLEGSTVGASQQRQQAIDRLNDLLHSGYNFIASVPSDDITDAERAQVFESYGWEGGLLGDMSSPSRLEALANAAISATADPSVPAQGKYSATLVSRITNWLGIFDAASAIANGGSRQVMIQQRNDARDQLAQADSRVRLAYCSASDDGESTPELAKIGMQPRRAPGDAQPQPLPVAPGAATYNNVARELTIPAMPDHATFLRAYRQPAGGAAAVAGVSSTPTVSVVGISPLTPGVTYQAWLVGVNSRGEGAESNKISFTA
ncbi:MAG: hypothetical protein M3Z64_10115 [Verrucomicrobiota bacterium]|nr:hypothetical protein [Verrucomicrobiota bacterium]